ncbi:MAG: ABC transporter ATP-binding protein [Bacteroidetes bacterium]|nr:ABC transporter ATP-binding protein [Bacteroidota bacterium]
MKSPKKFNLGLLGRIMKLALPKRGTFYATIALTLTQGCLSAIQPNFYSHAIDNYIMKGTSEGLGLWCILILALLITQTFLGFLNSWLSEKIGQDVILRMRNYTYKHLIHLRQSFFDKTPVGTSVTRTISDIETMTELFSAGLINIAGDAFQIFIILVCMFIISWKLTLLTLLVLPFLLWAANFFRKGVRDSFQQVRNEVSRLNSFIQERVTGMHIVQLFNRQEKEFSKFNKINASHRDAHIRGIFYYAVFFPIVEFLVAVALAIILLYGTSGIMKNRIQPGELTAFIMFVNLFFRPVRAIADRFNNIQMGMVAAERIFQLLDDADNTETSDIIMPDTMKGEIRFENVWFAYEAENWVIRNLSFTVKPGETFAIVGHTGSGKTTVIGLISRFYRHQRGKIYIDGIEIESYNLESLRKRIIPVLQDVFLFSGSIADNIRLKNEVISDEEIAESARMIGAYDFIDHLPGKFEFNVMERGMSLSLGQRQLISFIRALACKPEIIILDEATSNIDSETELIIQKAILELLNNRTAVVIAHRLSTIRHADRIFYLKNGENCEEGTHTELMKLNGLYASMYKAQQLSGDNIIT